jgi:type II secretory pathway component PulK
MRASLRRRGPIARRGYALLSALWIMVMLSGLGLHVATRTRVDRRSAANRIEAVRARAGAAAGAEHARARLTAILVAAESQQAGARVAPWRMVDTMFADTLSLGTLHYVVRLRDANARLHLHHASTADVAALLVALRVDAGRADRAAQAIADWQDADELRHPRGAEREDYLRAGARELPPNAMIARLEQLQDVRDIDADLLELLLDHLTLRGSGRINANTASEAVLLSLPGFTPEVTATVMQLRAGNVLISSSEQLLASMPSGARNRLADRSAEWMPRVVFDTREVEFESEAWIEGSPVRSVVEGTFVRAGTGVLSTDRRVR